MKGDLVKSEGLDVNEKHRWEMPPDEEGWLVGSESLTSKVTKAWLLGIFEIQLKMCECAVGKVLQLQRCASLSIQTLAL